MVTEQTVRPALKAGRKRTVLFVWIDHAKKFLMHSGEL